MSLYACIPLPHQVNHQDGHITLHPKLERNDARKLDFDLLDPGRCDAQLRQWGNTCYEPATNPPLPSLVLLIQGFPWPIVVHASTMRWGVAAVTVLDVITELSRALQLPAAEYAVQDGLMGSTRGADPQSSKAAPEIRRLEYLRGKSRLVGLSHSILDGEALMVHIE
ncbi:hypothetical protein EYR40_011095 [Pleurotus pulmonarius]|nr:hypothetical protein EYR36_002863 [Pleurotus pulmonarius]KAF4587074.1 hypothetical protein EYR40_011095 [Pleurotus pulmonarius]